MLRGKTERIGGIGYMIRFNNDYNRGAHPKVLEAFEKTNTEQFGGYGDDDCCKEAIGIIRDITHCPKADVYFFAGATQANFVVISSLIGSCDSVICADTGHIMGHECASIEHAGRKMCALPSTDGKINAGQIKKEAQRYYDSGEPEYMTRPSLVYISFPTEYGTIYTKAELQAISDVCKEYNMFLFVDGARLGYGLGAKDNDLTIADIARLADVFYIGGTKCGAMFGEAVVITDPAETPRFKSHMKQNGAVLAKGWCLGLQFDALLKDDLYFDITRQADDYAMRIRDAFREKEIKEYIVSSTNQQFVVLDDDKADRLSKEYVFEREGRIDERHILARFCTAWSTTKEETDALVESIINL